MDNVNFYISNSGINTFNVCSQKFKLKFIDKINRNKEITNKYFSFDKSIHAAIASLNSVALTEVHSKICLLDIIENTWISSGYNSYDEEIEFKYKACKMLNKYTKAPKDIGKENLIINKVLQMKLNNNSIITSNTSVITSNTYVISGKIDKLYERFDGRLEVVDYKSGSVINKPLDFNNNFQLPLYMLLAYNNFGIYPYAISYYYLTYNKKFTYYLTDNDIANANCILNNMITKIKQENVFKCAPNPYCQCYCEYFNMCSLKSFQKKNPPLI